MGPRGRSKRKLHSESGTSVGDSEEIDDTTTTVASASRPRRSRVPKRYLDDDYSPPPSKKRAGNRSTPSDAGDEEVDVKLEPIRPSSQQTPRASVATPGTSRSLKSRGRPKKNPTPPRRKSLKQRQEDDVIYMDDDSEEEEESSDDEFIMNEEQKDDLDYSDEDLNFSDIKPNIEEETFCPWIENPETLPKLDLPETSQDIPIPISSTMDAIEIYEILRSYHRTLRITPFTFEDFCAALISKNNSCIMAEVHMALLRVCLKSDDEELTQYSVTETNNSVNIMIHHMDTLTYAEILRQYIEAYPFTDSCVRDAINVENYPYVGYEPKIVVLLFMSYRFLYSSEFKKVVSNMGRFQTDENCRVCGKSNGRVVGCSQCEASFHVECSNLKPFPEILVCNICKRNSVRGVLPLDETVEKEPLRSQPIGRDRYGRFYWFICRRIIIQSVDETEIHYYSTPPQLYQLLQRLDRHYYEKDLCEAIRLRVDEFLEQMTLTVEMTAERREAAIDNVMRKSMIGYEFAEATISPIYLHKDSMKRMASILRDCSEKVIKQETTDTDQEEEDGTRSSGPLEKPVSFDEDSILPESMLGIFNGSLINTFWSGGASQEELIQSFVQSPSINAQSLWRMGDEENDQSFMQYYNYYMRNEMAESFLFRKKAADKKKYMASKFSIIEQFEWVVAKDRQFYGNSVLHNKFVGWTLSKIARKIPTDLMHRKWNEASKGFDIEISVADDYKKLAHCLLQLDAATRKTIYVQQWWSGLGQTKLERITLDQRENFNKDQQRNKKLEMDALAKDLDDSFIRVNYSKPKWPNTYILRQKGETYRNAGKGMMGGWAWVAKKYVEKWVTIPKKPMLPLDDKTTERKIESTSNQKARNLERLITGIVRKRDCNKSASIVANNTLNNKCYSPSCRNSKTFTVPNAICYSPSCRNGIFVGANDRHVETETIKKEVLGEDKAWPIPEIQTFATKRGFKSIFVLQKKILRQMILTAGCQQVYMPGFSAGIKSNLLIWPYPAPRPTLDLCWKWQTLNSRSLHSVALQLKIMWSSIKWNEFEPDDTHPDRRVVIDTPSHDERRRIIRHKEMPPYGQYERYELEIEIIPLYDEQEEEDDSWLSRNRSSDCSQRGTSRKKRSQRNLDNRQATAIRKEWVDGVTLKAFEIKDYWKWVRMEAEKMVRRKIEAAKKMAKAKEDAERQRLMMLQRPVTVHRVPSIALERTNVPYMGANRRSAIGIGQDSNESGRNLEKYNNSDLQPRSSSMYYPPSTSSVHRVQPNPVIRRVPVSSNAQLNRFPLQQNQYITRVAAGADSTSNGTALAPQRGISHSRQNSYSLHHNQHQQRSSQVANGQHYHDGISRNGGGVQIIQQNTPMHVAQRRLVLTPVGEPTTSTRQTLSTTEEVLGSNSPTNDSSDHQLPIGNFSSTGPQRAQQPVRQIHPGQVVVRPSPGTTGNVVYLKSTVGGTQKMMIRKAVGPSETIRHQGYPPGTVLDRGQSSHSARPIGIQQSQQIRQILTPGGAQRYVRVQNPINRQTDQTSRRVLHAGQQLPIESSQHFPPQLQQPPPVPQNPRFIIQGRTPPPKPPNETDSILEAATQMTQQHRDLNSDSETTECAHINDPRGK